MAMANVGCVLRLRISFDAPPPGMPSSTKYMILIEPQICRTVADVERVIKRKFGYSKKATLSLQLGGYTLPSTEKVEILQNDDSLSIQLYHINTSHAHTPKKKSKKRKMRSQSPQPSKKSKTSERETEIKPEMVKKRSKKHSKDVKKKKHEIKTENANVKIPAKAHSTRNSKSAKQLSMHPSKPTSTPTQTITRKNDKHASGKKKIKIKTKKSRTQTIVTDKGNKVTKFASTCSESSSDSDDATIATTTLNGTKKLTKVLLGKKNSSTSKCKSSSSSSSDEELALSAVKSKLAQCTGSNSKSKLISSLGGAKKNSSTSETSSSSSSSSEEKPTLSTIKAKLPQCTVKPELLKKTNYSTYLKDTSDPISGHDMMEKAVENKDTFLQSSQEETTEIKTWLTTAMNKLAQKHADEKDDGPKIIKITGHLPTECDIEKPAITLPKREYGKLKALTWPPAVNDIIAYKILEMTEHYTPEISDFKEATVLEVYSAENSATGANAIKVWLLLPAQNATKMHNGRFEMDLGDSSDEDLNDDNDNVCLLDWASLIDPRIVEVN